MNNPTPPKQSLLATASGDLCVTAFAIVLALASFAAKTPDPYLFPRIIAITLLLLCVAQLVIVFRGADTSVQIDGIKHELWQVLPSAIVIVVYVLLAEWLGFFAAAGLAFFVITLVGAKTINRKQVVIAAITSAGAVGVLYALFSLLLRVQSPRGILF